MTLTERKAIDRRWVIVFGGTVMIATGWLLAVLFSEANPIDGLALVMAQTVLTFLALFILMFGQTSSAVGPVVSQVIALHVLVYYGLSNVVPALLPFLRPQAAIDLVSYRIPTSPVSSYVQATIASLLFLLSIEFGSRIARQIIPIRVNRLPRKNRRYAWLPNYQYSLVAAVTILLVLLFGTARYGLNLSNTLTDQTIADFSLGEQLLFHGLFPFLPVAPLLAASAYIQATTSRQRGLTRNLLFLITLSVLGSMLVWRMRSTAIIATVLPIVLLAYAGVITRRRVIVAVIITVLMIYGAVTSVRNNLERNDFGGGAYLDVLSNAVMTVDVPAVLERAVFDISYRTAGLEGVAAILDFQGRGVVGLQSGSVTAAGFAQAMPAALRSEFQSSKVVKIAPSYLGIFLPGDWVTTFLAEMTLDFGVLWLFFPAVMAGLLISSIDTLMFRMGQIPSLNALLVLRIPFLLFPLTTGSSFAALTLLYFKATIGYLVLLWLIGLVIRLRTPRSISRSIGRGNLMRP